MGNSQQNLKFLESQFKLFVFKNIQQINSQMIPQGLKQMFGLNDAKDINMANNIWKMLDEMSESDPDAYKKFIEKNLTEGIGDAKTEKQKRQKKYKIIPKQYLLLQMDANLSEKVLTEQPAINQKLNLNKQKWSDVKAKFTPKIRIFLNICSSDRVKPPTRRPHNTPIPNFQIGMLKQIQCLYYSIQGPLEQKIKNNQQQIHYYCMILNLNFIQAFDKNPNGRKILLGLAVSYFQERLQNDRNPLLRKFDPYQHKKVAFYSIEKISIEFSKKKYKYGKDEKVGEFLLEEDVDSMQRQKKDSKMSKKQSKKKVESVKQEQIQPVRSVLGGSQEKNPFIILPKEQEKPEQQMKSLLPIQQSAPKKNLIQVIESKEENEQIDEAIPYEMKQTEEEYLIEFLVHGILSIKDLDLQVNQKEVRLKTLGLQHNKSVIVKLGKPINSDSVKAKMKKKSHTLTVRLQLKN